jgi:hypothetical protein
LLRFTRAIQPFFQKYRRNAGYDTDMTLHSVSLLRYLVLRFKQLNINTMKRITTIRKNSILLMLVLLFFSLPGLLSQELNGEFISPDGSGHSLSGNLSEEVAKLAESLPP